jgi:predicted AAA+ superfamily ATPase
MQEVLQKAFRLSHFKLSQGLPDYRRYLYDDVAASPAQITGVYGARGVGKTTLLLQILKAFSYKPDEKLYITCDQPMFYDVDLFDFCDTFAKYGGKIIVIDEIHKAKDFEQNLKLVYDFLDLKVYFSGSSAIKLTNASFARRYSRYRLGIFSFREYLENILDVRLERCTLDELLANHVEIADTILQALPGEKILKHYRDFLDTGAYPFYFEDPGRYLDRLNENINTILYEDLTQTTDIDAGKIITLKKLLYTVCVSNPMEISLTSLSKTVGITKPTLYKYIEYLSRAELLHHIMHEAKRFKNIKKPDKLYLNNTNLFNALCLDKNRGTLRETFFVSMLYLHHAIHYSDIGDFLVDEKYVFEIGGKNKGFGQIKDEPNGFVAADDIEVGFGNKIPLWLFGFLY